MRKTPYEIITNAESLFTELQCLYHLNPKLERGIEDVIVQCRGYIKSWYTQGDANCIAEQLHRANREVTIVEDNMYNKFLEIFKVRDFCDLPFDDTKSDFYDNSLELLNVKDGFKLTKEMKVGLFGLGFYIIYVNYCDGSEKSYYYLNFAKEKTDESSI